MSKHRYRVLLSALVPLFAGASVWAQLRLASPDQQIKGEVTTDAAGRLRLAVEFKGEPVVSNGALGITVSEKDLGAGATLGAAMSRTIDETYPVLGGHAVARNHCVETTIPVSSDGVSWFIDVRTYNDGVAYRYRVPGAGERRVAGEASAFTVPSGSQIFFQTHNNRKDYENPWQSAALADLDARLTPKPPAPRADGTPPPVPPPAPPGPKYIAAPTTLKLPGERGYLMLTEANLVNYSDMALEYRGGETFQAYFHNDPKWFPLTGEIVTPWRTMVIAGDLNTLVNTDIVRNLCPPAEPELAGAEWIKPGRALWHWMVVGRPKFEAQKQWIDWAKALGFEYYMIDDGWKLWRSGDKDAWGCMKELTDYAAANNVSLWAWVDSKDIRDAASRQAYFAKASELGLKGVKIDFMKPANTEWVAWYEETIRDAARAKLMVNFHGALRPTGRDRTLPNDITREAVRGREMGKQPPLHDTILPFTRMVQGPCDYTPTDFRTGTDAKTDKLKGSSFAHELSMAIIFTSPFFCYGGDPANYLQNEAVDILKAIPATWDETRVLPGSEIGELAAYARRKGDSWFIGVMNGAPRTLPISLSFLGTGSYTMERLADSPERNDAFVRSSATVTAADKMNVELRKDGGFVARITPAKP